MSSGETEGFSLARALSKSSNVTTRASSSLSSLGSLISGSLASNSLSSALVIFLLNVVRYGQNGHYVTYPMLLFKERPTSGLVESTWPQPIENIIH